MQTIIYIYGKSEVTPILQIFDATNLTLSARTNEPSVATFKIPLYTPSGEIHEALKNEVYLKKKNKIIIAFLTETGENIQFSGYISGVNDTELATEVTATDTLGECDERIIFTDSEYGGKTADFIIRDIFKKISDKWKLDFRLSDNLGNSEILHKKYTSGSTFLSILKDLAGVKNIFYIRDGVLYFGEHIGRNLTMGENFTEFRYDFRENLGRNIANFSFSSQSKNIKNIVVAKNQGGVLFHHINNESVQEYGRMEAVVSVDRSREFSKFLQDYATEHGQDNVELILTPSMQDYGAVEIGDRVRVYIDRGDARAKYDGEMVVQSKNYSGERVEFGFSKWNRRTQSLFEKLVNLDREIENIKNL